MKKFLLFLLCSLVVVLPVSAYTVVKGDTPFGLWGINWKAELAKYGISDPTKLPVGLEVDEEQKLGLAPLDVVALYEDNLAVGITSADTSFTVVRGTDKEGTLLNGTFGFILDEGTTLEEFIIGTASGTSITAVERGISVTDGKTQKAGNKKAHRKGASIKMTNYPILGRLNSIITGKESTGSSTFMIGDDTNQLKVIASTTKTIYSIGNTGNPFLRYNGTNWQFSDDGVNTTNLVTGGSGLSASSTKGIEITDSKIIINASSTTGLDFDSNGALYQKVSSSLYSDSDGIGVTVNTLVAGGVATRTPTANMIPIASSSGYLDSLWLSYQNYAFFGSGVDGDVVISASTTLTSDKYYTNLTINDGVVVNTANYRVFVKNKLTFLGTGKFASNGGAGGNGEKNNTAGGNGGSGGAGVPKGYFNTSTAGSAGGQGGSNSGGSFGDIGDAGTAGTAAVSSVLGVNGVAGSGGTDACTGGRAGAAGAAGSGGNLPTYLYKYSNPTTTYSLDAINNFVWQDVYYLSSNPTTHILFAGAGAGGGGGGAGFQATGCACTSLQGAGGGGGGGAGGIIYISARQVYTTANVFAEALGGVGGNAGGVPCAGDTTLGLGGGGGGGNGGLVVLIYNEFYGTGTATTTGGLGGLTGNLSTRSNTGNSGKYIFVKLDL